MTNTNFTYYGEATISKTRSSFKIELEKAEVTIFVPFNIVEQICERAIDYETMVAVLLAYIEVIRKNSFTVNVKNRKIRDDILISNTIRLLEKFSAEQLIEVVKELKWHEIERIFNSENPENEIDEFV